MPALPQVQDPVEQPVAPPERPSLEKKEAKKKAPAQGVAIDETLRVSAKKLDDMIQMVGELSIQQNVASHRMKSILGNSGEHQTQYQLRRLTRDLYEKALSLRMQPIQPIFQRLDRTIREIGATLQKKVQVELVGGEVELDKTVCEKIIEPLTHMVRNSVDHGLESNEDRLKSGKSESGKVKLIAAQEPAAVVLMIEDDGKGLNVEKIRAKAIERGMIQESTPLTQSETFALIFLPGFSTAEKVTDVSGRGVGMDVVMRAIDSLKGQISIASEVGKGTRFTIKLPTSLSLIDALIVHIDSIEYAVPLDMIDEVVDYFPAQQSNPSMLSLRERVLPSVSLTDYLKIRKKQDTKTTDGRSVNFSQKAIVVRAGNHRVAFKVDGVGDQQQIVVRNLSENLTGAQGISGGTILSSGEPGLIIDIDSLAKIFLQTAQPKQEVA